MSCRETNGSRDIFIHICIIDFSIRYAQSQSACRLSDSERNDNEVLFSQPHIYGTVRQGRFLVLVLLRNFTYIWRHINHNNTKTTLIPVS